MTYAALSIVQFDELEEWETEVQNDPKLLGLIQDLMQDINSSYTLKDRKLFFKGRLMLPQGS